MAPLSCLTLLFVCLGLARGRIHKLTLEDDTRPSISLTTFGFFQGGLLDVKLINFHADNLKDDDVIGFSLNRIHSDAMNPNLEAHQDRCLLTLKEKQDKTTPPIILFIMDRKSMLLQYNSSSSDRYKFEVYRNMSQMSMVRPKREDYFSDGSLFKGRSVMSVPVEEKPVLPISAFSKDGVTYYNTSFLVYFPNENEEGLYNLYFHVCPNYNEENPLHIFCSIEIEEKNKESFLSAGEMPLPALYFMMSLLFFLSGCFWVFILAKSKQTVFKIHYLMAVLVYLKSLSLLFHAINFHFIETKGEHVAAWAILYYIAHLLKGSVLFITIVLIGTGWTFIKHLLSDRDKKIFMIVIPLQVLANVVKIIFDESEEGDAEHKTWLDVFMLVDLLCCGAILFPVVWSIRYLQEAACIDGKAAINLRKLKLFRHFYIMIVCYIYFTRIIVYLLQMTVSFQYKWLDEMFKEMVTYVFFVLTGYKFRPASANPYFQLNTDEEDVEEDIIVSQCGVTEGLSKLSRISNEQTEEEMDTLLLSKREASHEYD
ncbi:Lung seven transmembrane receptor [Nesidiocoris tenuis]|uniref:Lung seven transmembrane receptor n=1 Tax=Nesidiocoris tenuis TaxID=355587 RepID=A0ABN7B3E1_9HEMI|nr:Lung seven transmembrane receptor [Nesidiocoris tenuis]